ncbi:ABC transporter permease subunit [Pseudoalteromonas tunicata]|uniref:ABC transporter permease subunit n=1 Tax=Pseudoalteromonas tunicata TaxID=314281 RepID=UPI00273F406D|nr:ABC transporter permease subunit [Pseudoalteromonas tunicata]MDP4982969.1 ABC transporter permease subunit [Pseudoalteromonas tunicata]MDP5211561.1 ABC transporter permease subunit [Pseudoalteromonas tunicata]
MFIQQSINRAWCLATFELVRLFFTKRGLLALAAFATVWFVILRYPVNSAVTIVSSEDFRQMAMQMFGVLGLSELLTWKVPELAIYWLVALYSFPLFALFAASDQTCSDRTRGTLRFITLRATRNEVVFGRFIGQLLIVTALIALTLLATILMATYRESALLMPGLAKGIGLFKELILAVIPFIALMAFLNSFIRSSKLAIVMCVLFYGIGSALIAILTHYIPFSEYLYYIYPGFQLNEVIGQQSFSLSSYLIPVIQSACYLAAASLVMKRSSL